MKEYWFEVFFVILAPVKRLFVIIGLLMLHVGYATAAKDKTSSQVLSRMFAFQEKYNPEVKGKTMQVYTKHYYETYRRNFSLWLIPSMYTIAGGERKYVSEQFNLITIKSPTEFDNRRLAYYTTIPRNRTAMSVLNDFSLPKLYHPTIYGNHVLSPFCRENRHFYKYKVSYREAGRARIDFRPRMGDNTQLVAGTAIIQAATGRILDVVIKGEYDMIDFYTTIKQGNASEDSLAMPKYCKTDVNFKFLGNHIASSFTSVFNNHVQLPDTIDVVGNRHLMDSIRPLRLSKDERAVYQMFDSLLNAKTDSMPKDSTASTKTTMLKELGWDVGSYLVSSHSKSSEKYRIRLSPLIEPQYLSYSRRRGLSYKMKFSARYYFTENSNLYFKTTLGYNFKIKQLYAYVPVRYIYNKEKDNYLELLWDVGNRIGNSAVIDELKAELGELPELKKINLDEFNDNEIRLRNYTQINKAVRVELGMVYHRRTAVDKKNMKLFNKPTVYQSLAPSLGLYLLLWQEGPLLSINYERAIRSKAFELDYERWETCATKKIHLPSTKLVNLQVGAGLYTRRKNNYFMQFMNFYIDNVPGGWDDEWSGDFQLLDSRLYNISHYYVSSNVSYDSPLLMASFIPKVGRYIERERLYWSGLLIEYSRPYHELGYGFSTKFFSTGLFAGFFDLAFYQFGAKFTLELFRRW